MEKVSIGIRTYNPLFVCRTLLTARPSGHLYSSAELGRLCFCELQQRSDIF
jgi:hypothetical protein